MMASFIVSDAFCLRITDYIQLCSKQHALSLHDVGSRCGCVCVVWHIQHEQSVRVTWINASFGHTRHSRRAGQIKQDNREK